MVWSQPHTKYYATSCRHSGRHESGQQWRPGRWPAAIALVLIYLLASAVSNASNSTQQSTENIRLSGHINQLAICPAHTAASASGAVDSAIVAMSSPLLCRCSHIWHKHTRDTRRVYTTIHVTKPTKVRRYYYSYYYHRGYILASVCWLVGLSVSRLLQNLWIKILKVLEGVGLGQETTIESWEVIWSTMGKQ